MLFQCGFILLMATSCVSLYTGDKISRQRRIIGGSVYGKTDYPFHVSLWYMAENSPYKKANPAQAHSCAGSLVGDKWVLTAGHCFDNNYLTGLGDPGNWYVYLGMYEQSKACDEAQFRTITNIYKHTNYTAGYLYYADLTLLKLSQPATVNSRVAYARLNDQADCPQKGDSVDVIGWGKTSNSNTKNSNLPKKVTLMVNDTAKCDTKMNEAAVLSALGTSQVTVDHTFLCVESPNKKEDSCYGDSGGPLLATCGGHSNVVVGAVSYGYECAKPGYPSVYTKISHYYKWIQNTMRDNA